MQRYADSSCYLSHFHLFLITFLVWAQEEWYYINGIQENSEDLLNT
jgi:hypothetical protein